MCMYIEFQCTLCVCVREGGREGHTLRSVRLRRKWEGLGGGVRGLSHRRPSGPPHTSTKLSVLQDTTYNRTVARQHTQHYMH